MDLKGRREERKEGSNKRKGRKQTNEGMKEGSKGREGKERELVGR